MLTFPCLVATYSHLLFPYRQGFLVAQLQIILKSAFSQSGVWGGNLESVDIKKTASNEAVRMFSLDWLMSSLPGNR